ncbi:hypothetical protein EDB19DRAFT_1824932 [Suillus lakei]|nr:hypothetical protein EDB19DRAFT_1824932 [Suillus lakei]
MFTEVLPHDKDGSSMTHATQARHNIYSCKEEAHLTFASCRDLRSTYDGLFGTPSRVSFLNANNTYQFTNTSSQCIYFLVRQNSPHSPTPRTSHGKDTLAYGGAQHTTSSVGLQLQYRGDYQVIHIERNLCSTTDVGSLLAAEVLEDRTSTEAASSNSGDTRLSLPKLPKGEYGYLRRRKYTHIPTCHCHKYKANHICNGKLTVIIALVKRRLHSCFRLPQPRHVVGYVYYCQGPAQTTSEFQTRGRLNHPDQCGIPPRITGQSSACVTDGVYCLREELEWASSLTLILSGSFGTPRSCAGSLGEQGPWQAQKLPLVPLQQFLRSGRNTHYMSAFDQFVLLMSPKQLVLNIATMW